jgi:hypothetical protein
VNWPMLALFPFSGKEAPDQVDSLDWAILNHWSTYESVIR